VRRRASFAQVPLADNNARKTPHTRGTLARNPAAGYRNCRDANHKTIRLFVTGADQAAIARSGRAKDTIEEKVMALKARKTGLFA
jgi:hypothetical protein